MALSVVMQRKAWATEPRVVPSIHLSSKVLFGMRYKALARSDGGVPFLVYDDGDPQRSNAVARPNTALLNAFVFADDQLRVELPCNLKRNRYHNQQACTSKGKALNAKENLYKVGKNSN